MATVAEKILDLATWLSDRFRRRGYFWQLPSPAVRLYERTWTVQYAGGAPPPSPGIIGWEIVPEGQLLVVTDLKFFCTRTVAADNDRPMESTEMIGVQNPHLGFMLFRNGSPAYDSWFATFAAGVLSAGPYAGCPLLNQNKLGYRPQFAVYFPPKSRIEARYIVYTNTITTPPDYVIVHINGYTMPWADYQKSLPEGSVL